MKKFIVLGIDTTGLKCSAGIAKDGKSFGEISENTPQEHSERIVPIIEKLLKRKKLALKDINGIAISVGPGSYTGLRVGVASAKTLAQLLKIPIVSVSTLDAIALNTVQSTGYRVQGKIGLFPHICVIMDARKQQVYSALYKTTIQSTKYRVQSENKDNNWKIKKTSKDLLVSIDDMLELRTLYSAPRTVFIGNGLLLYGDTIKKAMGNKAIFADECFWYPNAGIIAAAGYKKLKKNIKGENLFKLNPKYIREPDIRK